MRDLSGKTALVTGAASGIGRCIALALATEGSNLALVDLDGEGLGKVRVEVESLGVAASIHVMDVTDTDAVDALAGEVRPAILVNCAGIAIMGEAENTSAGEWSRVLDVNLRGPIDMCAAFLPSLKERGGHIVNVASVDGLLAIPGSAAYSTSKFGLVGFSEAIGIELSRYGIGVTAVCPGFTWTPMVDTIFIGRYDRKKVDRLLRLLRPVVFTTPEKLAAATIKAVKKNRAVVVHTPVAKMVYFIKRLSPGLYRDLVGIPVSWLVRTLER
jgi:NAD(P)-dependent dehydrogenase (short-subunit alcohol dehydrogenase family)